MDKTLTASTLLNKGLAFGLALTLVAWTFASFMVLPAQAVDVHPEGSLVVSGSTVYKVMGGQRMGFPSANVFLSHGYAWAQIAAANSADLALSQGSNVMFADGTLVNDGGTVFIISNGMKRGFTSASTFTGLGYSWANVINDSLASYTQGANVDSVTAAHPAGTLVNSSGTIWHMVDSERHGIPTLAVFQSNGYDFAKVVPANAGDLAVTAGANFTYRVGSLVNDGGTVWAITSSSGKQGFPSATCYTDFGFSWSALVVGSTSTHTAGTALCGGGPTPPSSTGNLSVSLASDTPASGIAIKSAARVGFTKVNLTASGGDVTVDTWVVKRTGVGQDSSFSSIDIIDLSTNASINDTGKTFNTDHLATFTENLTIKSGETRSVMLAGNIAASPGSGEQPSLTLQSMTLVGGTLNGSFPITGNTQTINTSITIGTATVQRGSYTNATSTTIEVGKLAYTFFSFSIQAGSAEDVTFSQVKVYQQGSASLASDLANIKLYRDGTFLANGTVSGNYVNFTFPQETLTKGQTGQYLVKADVIGGSARTVDLGLYRATDLLVTGTTYGANISPSVTGAGSSSNAPVLSDNTFTISTGTMRVGRSNTVGAGNITVGSGQTLGAFEFEAKGEAIVITALTLTISSSTGAQIEDALQSVKLVDANGKTVAGPTDVTNDALTVVFSDTFTAPVGTSHYKVVGTLATNGGWATNDTIFARLATPASAITAKGEVTGQSVTATPSSNIDTSTQTVKAAGLTVTKNSTPTNKTVITNSTGVLAGSWTLDATNAGEDVRITSLALKASTTGKLNNLTLKEVSTPGGTVVAALSPVNDAPTAGAIATSTFALTNPLVVTKGTSKIIDLYVDVGSNSVAGEANAFGITSAAAVTAYGVTTGNSATITVVTSDGAILTIAAAGTLTVNLDSSAPSIRQVVFGSTGVSLSEVRLKATNEAINVTKLTVGIVDGALTGTNSGDFSQVTKVFLKKDGSIVGNAAGYAPGQQNTVINLSVNDLQVPEGTTGIKLSVLGDLVAIGTNQPGEANDDIKVGLGPIDPTTAAAASTAAFNATGVGSNTAATMSYSDSTGSAMILHKSQPSVVIKTPTNKLAATSVLAEADVAAVGNTVGLYRMSYQVTTSTGINVTDGYLKLSTCGSCGGVADGSQLSNSVGTGSEIGTVKVWTFPVSSTQSHGKNFLQIAAGATAKVQFVATIGGFTTNSDSVATALLGDTATTTSDDLAGATAAAFTSLNQGNFVWSDLNANDTNSAGHTTKQWYNGYYVTGLGATTTSTPITVSE